jgi:hypothetical protein
MILIHLPEPENTLPSLFILLLTHQSITGIGGQNRHRSLQNQIPGPEHISVLGIHRVYIKSFCHFFPLSSTAFKNNSEKAGQAVMPVTPKAWENFLSGLGFKPPS